VPVVGCVECVTVDSARRRFCVIRMVQ